jgi:hypothetical protein
VRFSLPFEAGFLFLDFDLQNTYFEQACKEGKKGNRRSSCFQQLLGELGTQTLSPLQRGLPSL